MSEGYRAHIFLDGQIRKVCLHSQLEKLTLDRLLELSTVPLGGVYVIHHPPTDLNGRDFFREFKEKNPCFRAYVGYTTFETDSIPEPWVESCNQMDEIWVPSHFNAETFSKAGVLGDKIRVIPHGFDTKYYQPGPTKPLEIGQKKGFNFLSIFEWTYRKGWDVLIRAYLDEFNRDEDVRLIIRSYQGGGVIGPNVLPVVEQLLNFIISLGYDPENIPTIEFIDTMIPTEFMPSLYKAADAFILPTRGEGWGIPFTESMLMEIPVIATRWSGHLEFMNDENSYLIDVGGIIPVSEEQVSDNPLYKGHCWAEPSIAHTRKLMRHVFENREEARQKGRAAREYILNNFTIHHAALKIAERLIILEKKSPKGKIRSGKSSSLKILFQARPDIFTVPGGDTDVLVNLRARLEDIGASVDFSNNMAADLKGYDLVHIFNFDTQFAINAALQKKPYVVTPMYEDLNRYYAKSMQTVNLFRDYLDFKNSEILEHEMAALMKDDEILQIPPDCYFIASNAEAILVSGKTEGERIKKDFPNTRNVEVVALGFDRPDDAEEISNQSFISEYGVKDFVLCVGRLETRKNQLMLLYALKDEDIPIVFVDSRTIQPEYEEICKRFKRKGKTIFTGRISKEMLFSAYRAAKVHALPSWYELPGIVSLEAGWWGCNVVSSDWGTIRDYMGDYAYYCEPYNPESIRKSVMTALNNPPDPSFPSILEGYTWEKEAEKVSKIYQRILSDCKTRNGMSRFKSRVCSAQKELACHQLRGEAYKLSTKSPREAIEIASHLLSLKPDDTTSYFIKGTACLLLVDYPEAELNFKKTLQLQPYFDIKGYLYLGLALLQQEKYEEAIKLLQQGLKVHPFIPDETKALIYEYLAKSYKGTGDIEKASEMSNKIDILQAGYPKDRGKEIGVGL